MFIFDATAWGDTDPFGVLSGDQKGKRQDFLGGTLGGKGASDTTGRDTEYYGDAHFMDDFARGGKDRILGSNLFEDAGISILNWAVGDAWEMNNNTIGGNDVLQAGVNYSVSFTMTNEFYGDALFMNGFALGGNDTIEEQPIGFPEILNRGDTINRFYGDAYQMNDLTQGGADTIRGVTNTGTGTSVTNEIYGEAYEMNDNSSGAHAGKEQLYGGNHLGVLGSVTNTIYGDAYQMLGLAAGPSVNAGPDQIYGGFNASNSLVTNTLYGDAKHANDFVAFDRDQIYGGDNSRDGEVTNLLIGDTWEMAGSTVRQGGRDLLVGGDQNKKGLFNQSFGGTVENTLYGDAWIIREFARGGDDHVDFQGGLFGGDNRSDHIDARVDNVLYGDANIIFGWARGGTDSLEGGDNFGAGTVENFLSGDAVRLNGGIQGSPEGGDDTLTGGTNKGSGHVENTLFGDASTSLFGSGGSVFGGDDTLMGGDNKSQSGTVTNNLYGDARDMFGEFFVVFVHGGDDTIIGGDNWSDAGISNLLVGDADHFEDAVRGGNDLLAGGDQHGGGVVSNILIGDAEGMFSQGEGGNDVLLSGQRANDDMYGDAIGLSGDARGGDDTFVFNGAFRIDSIYDFGQNDPVLGNDKVVILVDGVNSFDDLNIVPSFAGTQIQVSLLDIITLEGHDNVANPLGPDDFGFTLADIPAWAQDDIGQLIV